MKQSGPLKIFKLATKLLSSNKVGGRSHYTQPIAKLPPLTLSSGSVPNHMVHANTSNTLHIQITMTISVVSLKLQISL